MASADITALVRGAVESYVTPLRDELAEAHAALARVRALCDEAEADRARGNMGLLRPPDVRAALDGEAT